jgi:hypothetical protein
MTSAIKDHPNCHLTYHKHDTTMRFNKVNMPISRARTSLTCKITVKSFPNIHLLSWLFPSGRRCTTLSSHFEIGMSFGFGFATPSYVACACLGRRNLAFLKDATSISVSLILMKIGHTYGT